MRRVLRSVIICLSSFVVLLVQFLSILPASVHAVTPYEASDVIGQPNFTNGRAYGEYTTSQTLSYPHGVALDEVHHRLFVADDTNNRVVVYNLNPDNQFLDGTADYVLGQPDFNSYIDRGGRTGLTSAHGFDRPIGVAYDAVHNRLFVLDRNNNRVLVFDTTTIVSNEDAVYVLGQSDYTSISTHTDANGFKYPQSLTYDPIADNLFVSDTQNNRVLIFDTATISNNESAVKVLGQADFITSTSDLNAKGFNGPEGIGIDSVSRLLFVCDSANNRVLVFDISTISDNEDAVKVLGQANFTTGTGDTNSKGFQTPMGIAFRAGASQLFVADTSNNRILIFDTTTIVNNEDAVSVLGQSDYTSSSSDVTAQGFNQPWGNLTIDSSGGYLYVPDTYNHRVLEFDTSSIVNNEDAVQVFGQQDFVSGYSNQTQQSNATGIYGDGNGSGTAIDTIHHRLFVIDGYYYRVLVFNLDGNNNLIDHTADNVLGCSTLTDTGCSSQNYDYMEYMGGVEYDPVHNRLFVTDLYDYQRVLVFDLSNGITNGMDASYVIGQPDFSSYGNNTTINGFAESDYGGLAYDGTADRLYVLDTYNNHRVMVFDVSPANIHNGMDASYVIGATNFTSVGAGGCAANEIPYSYGGIIVDPDHHRLFVSNYQCGNVLVYDTSNLSNGMSASNVLGCYGFTCAGDEYPAESNRQLWGPEGLGYDRTNQILYVFDYSRSAVVIFDVNDITNGEPAIGIVGQPDFDSSGSGTSQTSLYFDYVGNGAFDSANRRLYFPDDYNSRIMIFDFARLTATIPNGSVDEQYHEALNAYSQGTTTFSVTSGQLPEGLGIDSSTGILSGRPRTAGTYTFTVSMSDDNGVAGTFTDSKQYTMTIVPGGPKPDGENSTTEAPSCNDQVASAPDLFQLDRSGTTATVHFAPLSDSVSSYLISYGTDSTAEGYSVELPISHADGAVSQDIHDLNPSSSYSFKVRAQKGCMPGDWSSVKEASIQRSYTTISSSPVYQSTPSTSSKKTTTKQPSKRVIKRTAKSAKKTTKPKSITAPKSTKPWYMFW